MKKILFGCLAWLMLNGQVQADELFELSEQCSKAELNVVKCKVQEDISSDEVIDSMKLRANMLNFKLVGHLPLSEQVKAMGGESNRMEIFQFCDALIAAVMVKHSMAFGAYLPCRITLIEDDKGQPWLVTLDMDKTMTEANLPGELRKYGMTVRNNIYSIITAGVEGDL